MEILTLFLIAISLSLDAFSLSLAYGLLGIRGKKTVYSSITVGLFHFFMPLIGFLVGNKILSALKINPKFIIAIILGLIIVEIIRSLKDDKKLEEIKMDFINMLAFAFFVSLDSFTVGLGLPYITDYPLYASMIFAVISFIFTFLGFTMGKYVSDKIGKFSKYLGLIIFTILLIYFLI